MPTNNEIKVYPIGGYSEFGRNMTAVEVDEQIVIFDMGIKLDRILIHEDAQIEELNVKELQSMGAIPDDSVLASHRKKVVAIVTTHGHLDHIGAIPKLAGAYNCPVYATPYTARLIEQSFEREKHVRKPEIIPLPTGEIREVGHAGKQFAIELVRMTHSIVDSSLAVLHTPIGEIVYACDFKLDNDPVIGQKPDYDRFKALGSGQGRSGRGVALMIVETTRAEEPTKTPSESVARAILKDHLMGLDNDDHGMVITTFSSHLARIKSIVEYGRKIGREVILLGRSMEKYSLTGYELGFADWLGDPDKDEDAVEIWGRRRSVEKALGQIMDKGKDKYLIVTTGHQGEPQALLSRMAKNETPFKFDRGDHVIFSSNVIPNPMNEANFYVLKHHLKAQKARMIQGAHVSGHGAREDHHELLEMLKPMHVMPAHGDMRHQASYFPIAADIGMDIEKQVHVTTNSRTVRLNL